MPLIQTYGTRLKTAGVRAYDVLPSFVPPGPSGDIALMMLTLTANSAGGAKTSEPFSIIVPLAPGELGTGRNIRVYDDDGAGGKGAELANYQVTLPSTDLNGNTRLVCLAGIVPSIGSGATRKLRLETSDTAGPSGTAITTSDVLATAAQCVIEFDIAGTIYSFDARAALAASDTFSKTDYQLVLLDSGPTRTRWVAAGPPRSGGAAHASGDGLRVHMEIIAWKAGPGAVSESNPITLVEFHASHENEDAVRSAPAHYLYGWTMRRATSLSDGTLISTDVADVDGNVRRYSYPRSTPSADITLSASSTGTGRTCTRSAGVWPADILGAYIAAGNGKGVVTARTSDTQVTLWIVEAFSGTAHTAGNWSIEGVGHHYLTRYLRSCEVGTRPSSVCLWGDHTSAITPTSRAAMDVFAASRLGLNWSATFAAVSHSMTNLDAMRADGARRPLTLRGPEGTRMGDVETDISGTGMRQDIGPMPNWVVDGLIKCNADGRRKLFENAEAFSTWHRLAPRRLSGSPAAGELGLWPRSDNGTTFKFNPAQTGTLINEPTRWWPFDSDTAHHPAPFFVPYLLSGGRVYWLDALQRVAEWSTPIAMDSTFNGSGLNKTPYGDPTGTVTTVHGQHQTRGKAWSTRDLLLAWIATPDDLSAKIGNTKSYHTTRLTKTWDALKFWGPDDNGGLRSGATETPQWLQRNSTITTLSPVTSSKYEGPWQIWMNLIVLGWARDLGAMNAAGIAGYEWLAEFPAEVWASAATLNRNWVLTSYYMFISDTSIWTTEPTDWSVMYQRSCLVGPLSTGGGGVHRVPTGTVTLSDASVGSARTATFSNSYFAAGAWYVNGFIREPSSGGVFQITAVNSATQVTGNILTAFSSTTPTASNLRIPGPHPDDAGTLFDAITNPNYGQMCVAAARLLVDHGINTEAMNALIAAQTARSGYTEDTRQFQIAVRS